MYSGMGATEGKSRAASESLADAGEAGFDDGELDISSVLGL